MINLLRLKSWQIFLLFFIPVIVMDFADKDSLGVWSLLGTLWFFIIYLTWLKSIGSLINENKSKGATFNICYVYNVIYIFFLLGIFIKNNNNFPYWQIPIHLVAFIASFYMIYYSAKRLVTFETHHKIFNNDLFKSFISLWFVPIGVFFIQPRLNRAIAIKEV